MEERLAALEKRIAALEVEAQERQQVDMVQEVKNALITDLTLSIRPSHEVYGRIPVSR